LALSFLGIIKRWQGLYPIRCVTFKLGSRLKIVKVKINFKEFDEKSRLETFLQM
jgi:hypothetical protein